MLKTSYIITAALAVCLAACAPQQIVWDKPGLTVQSFNQDKLACMQTAQATVGGYMAFGTLEMVAVSAASNNRAKQEVFSTCMEAKGYMPRDANTSPLHMTPVPVTVTEHHTQPLDPAAEAYIEKACAGLTANECTDRLIALCNDEGKCSK